MAQVTKTGTPSISTAAPPPNCQLTGLLAGEAIGACDACFIHTDGLVYLADGSAADAEAVVVGFSAKPASAGEAVTLYWDVFFGYGPNVSGTPTAAGAPLYLSASVEGGLADAASTGGLTPIAYAVGDGRIYILSNWGNKNIVDT